MSIVSALEPLELPALPPDPLVSVLVANYNYDHFVEAALESLSGQTYGNFEALVCDDGSTDDSRAVIEHHAARDGRIRLIAKANGGVASALNAAYAESNGHIVCLLDADDTFAPGKLEAVVQTFSTTAWGLLVHPLMVVDDAGTPVQKKPLFTSFEAGWIAPRNVERGGRWMYMEASAVSLRRELADIAFPLPEERFRSWADAYICTLGAMLTPVGYIDEALANYRLHGSNLSGFSALSERSARKGVDGVSRVVEGVNQRLREIRPDAPLLDITRHLTYIESSFQAALFGGKTSLPVLLRRFAAYANRVLNDDLYSPARKAIVLGFHGTAIFLPRAKRERWVSAGMTESHLKQRLKAVSAAISKWLDGPLRLVRDRS